MALCTDWNADNNRWRSSDFFPKSFVMIGTSSSGCLKSEAVVRATNYGFISTGENTLTVVARTNGHTIEAAPNWPDTPLKLPDQTALITTLKVAFWSGENRRW